MPRRVGQQPEPWSHWPSQILSPSRPPRWVNQSMPATRAALSFTPCTMKTGMSAAVAPARQSRSPCHDVYCPDSWASPAVRELFGRPQPVSSGFCPKCSPSGRSRSRAICS